jgi:flagellar hook-associated protein 2
MVTQIALGTFFNFNGKNVLGGVGGSGLNTQSLLSSLMAVKSAPATALQQKITQNASVTSALAEFQQLLSTFQSVQNNLRNPPGVGNAADNAFAYNSTSITSNTSVSGSAYVSVNAQPGVTPQNFLISDITSLAAIGKQTTDPNVTFVIASADTAGLVVASGAAAGEFNAGTFSIRGIGSAPDADITLEEDDTLNDIIAKFNNVALQTGITANLVTVASGEYAISFTALQSGSAYAFDLDDPATVTADPSGVLSQINFDTTQDAADAEFLLDGIPIVRTTNVISDAVSGVAFTLLQTTPALTTVNVAVTSDTSTARSSIIAFADAYNALKEFEANQLQLNDDGTFAEESVLATNQFFRGMMNVITNQVLSVVNGLADGDPDNLTDIGITFTKVAATPDAPEISNVLTINDTQLTTALASDFDAVRRLFEFTFTSDNPNLRVFSRTNALSVNDFTLDINPFATQVTEELDVADADTQIVFASPADGQLGAGNITINGETIALPDGMTLNQIKAAFDAVEANTGVDATIGGSAGAFTLTFTSTRQDGELNLFDLTSAGVDASGVFDNVDITATGSFTATYDPGTGDTTIDLDGTAIAGGGGFLLIGQAGTVLEGLELVYGSQAATEAAVTATQGIADSLYNISEGVLEDDGTLEAELASITARDEDLEEQIERINEQVEQFRDVLLQKFAALEQAISRVNTLLATLSANDEARRLASGG